MTRDEAILAGQLAEAVERLDECAAEVAARPDDELTDMSIRRWDDKYDMQPASEEITVARWTMDGLIAVMRTYLCAELAKLGVEP